MLQIQTRHLLGALVCVLGFFMAPRAEAVFTISADAVNGSNGTQVDVSVAVQGFTSLIAMQGTLSWNPAVANYSSTLGYNLPGLAASSFGTSQVASGKLSFSWIDATVSGVTVPDGTVVFKVRFNVTGSAGSNTAVAFVNSPTALEFVDSSFSPIPFVANPGLITVAGGCSITSLAAGTQSTCNASNNTYTQQVVVTHVNAPLGGSLTVNGQDFPISASPQTVTLTGLTANGAAVPVAANFSMEPVCSRTTSNLFTAPASCATPSAVEISAGTTSGNGGSQVDVGITVREFTNIVSMQGTLSWDESVATFNSTYGYNLPGFGAANFGVTQVGSGKLTFNWNDATLTGVTRPANAGLFAIRFNLVGPGDSSTPLAFVSSPTPLEFVDNNFHVLPLVTHPGWIGVDSVIDPIFAQGFE